MLKIGAAPLGAQVSAGALLRSAQRRHRDRLRRHRAATRRSLPRARGRLGGPHRPREARRRGIGQRRAVPREAPVPPGCASRTSASATSPTSRAQGVVRRSGREIDPDLVLCPWRGDAHQDHRTVSELVGNTFRNQLVLEYEIPSSTVTSAGPRCTSISRSGMPRRSWRGSLRDSPARSAASGSPRRPSGPCSGLRGIESRAPSGLAEAFHC